MTRAGYVVVAVLLVALPFSVRTGAGVATAAGVTALALAGGLFLPWLRVAAAGLAVGTAGLAAGHGHGVAAVAVGAVAGVLALLLLTLPVDREIDGWAVRALALELPLAVVAAVLAGLPLGRLPLVLGAVAAAGLVAAALPADARRRRRG